MLAAGKADLYGDEFAQIFADSINGDHRSSPLGIADVIWNGCAWSAKTVKSKKALEQTKVRLISGRNSPDFSSGISDPRANAQKTGDAVLSIWNERINLSRRDHDELRIVVFIRNMEGLEFAIFETQAIQYPINNYIWRANKSGNFQGHDKNNDKHCFTWQPHGSQFTTILDAPGGAAKFKINKRPGLLEAEHVLNLVNFKDDWIEKIE